MEMRFQEYHYHYEWKMERIEWKPRRNAEDDDFSKYARPPSKTNRHHPQQNQSFNARRK